MLPEFFGNNSTLYQDTQKRMLSEEPEHALYGSRYSEAPKGSEEEKFDKAEEFDKGFLTKKFPSLAIPNVKNKEEIDILADLNIDEIAKEESKVKDVKSRERKRREDSRERSLSGSRDKRRRSKSRDN